MLNNFEKDKELIQYIKYFINGTNIDTNINIFINNENLEVENNENKLVLNFRAYDGKYIKWEELKNKFVFMITPNELSLITEIYYNKELKEKIEKIFDEANDYIKFSNTYKINSYYVEDKNNMNATKLIGYEVETPYIDKEMMNRIYVISKNDENITDNILKITNDINIERIAIKTECTRNEVIKQLYNENVEEPKKIITQTY